MRRIAIAVMLAGFLFTTLSIRAAGIDLLIDAVGFLLIFNAARWLAKLGDRFTPCIPLCLGLLAVAALQLFLQGTALAVLGAVRAAGEAALYLLLWRGFASAPDMGGTPGRRAALAAVFGANALAAAAAGLLALTGPAAAMGIAQNILLATHLALYGLLLWAAVISGDRRAEPKN